MQGKDLFDVTHPIRREPLAVGDLVLLYGSQRESNMSIKQASSNNRMALVFLVSEGNVTLGPKQDFSPENPPLNAEVDSLAIANSPLFFFFFWSFHEAGSFFPSA